MNNSRHFFSSQSRNSLKIKIPFDSKRKYMYTLSDPEGPSAPKIFFYHAVFRQFWRKCWAQGPPWGQNSAAPPWGQNTTGAPDQNPGSTPGNTCARMGFSFVLSFALRKNIIDEWHKRTGNLFSHQRDSDILWVSNNWDSSEFSWDRNKSFLRFKKTLSFKTEFGIFLRQFWVFLRQFEFSWESLEFLKIEFWVFLREFRVSWVRVWSFLRHSLGFSWIPEMEF